MSVGLLFFDNIGLGIGLGIAIGAGLGAAGLLPAWTKEFGE
ncbi:MAG TPA: hypothetical protein VGT61_13475 [Thermomicrobiales bacterium]|jgi:hypothetical protein|nr:hypothetical protein [Thermomicrobiales bacterium]